MNASEAKLVKLARHLRSKLKAIREAAYQPGGMIGIALVPCKVLNEAEDLLYSTKDDPLFAEGDAP